MHLLLDHGANIKAWMPRHWVPSRYNASWKRSTQLMVFFYRHPKVGRTRPGRTRHRESYRLPLGEGHQLHRPDLF